MRSIALALAAVAACLCGGPASAAMVCFTCVIVDEPSATTIVSSLGGGEYQYSISIGGDGGVAKPVRQVTDFYIPYFADMGIAFGGPDFGGSYASYSIEDDSIFGLGGEVLHYRFSTPTGSYPVNQRIVFDAAFKGAKAPFLSDLVDSNGNRTVFRGDPLIPGSPEFLAALDGANRVAEPGALALLLAGMGAMLGLRRRRAARTPVWAPA